MGWNAPVADEDRLNAAACPAGGVDRDKVAWCERGRWKLEGECGACGGVWGAGGEEARASNGPVANRFDGSAQRPVPCLPPHVVVPHLEVAMPSRAWPQIAPSPIGSCTAHAGNAHLCSSGCSGCALWKSEKKCGDVAALHSLEGSRQSGRQSWHRAQSKLPAALLTRLAALLFRQLRLAANQVRRKASVVLRSARHNKAQRGSQMDERRRLCGGALAEEPQGPTAAAAHWRGAVSVLVAGCACMAEAEVVPNLVEDSVGRHAVGTLHRAQRRNVGPPCHRDPA
eukprot:364955-Chlamydomonas_euryale.AAC.30